MIITGLDTETTGLEYAEGHKIIEISMSVYKDRDRKLCWTQRINPMRLITPKAQAVHKITAADLVGKPTFKDVAPTILSIMNHSDVLVAHNGFEFDFPFLVHEIEQAGFTFPDVVVFDTMQEGRWATPDGKVPTLGELCFACGVPYDPAAAHAAEYDTDKMMECLFVGMDLGFFHESKLVKR